MAQPFLFRSSLSLALVTALQYLLPGFLIGLTLAVISWYFDWPFQPFLMGLAAVAWLLSALILRPTELSPELRFTPLRLVSSVFVRWAVLVISVMAIGYVSGLSEYYPRRVILPWATISPFVASATLLALQLLLRRV